MKYSAAKALVLDLLSERTDRQHGTEPRSLQATIGLDALLWTRTSRSDEMSATRRSDDRSERPQADQGQHQVKHPVQRRVLLR
jgi:hypothetical protein